MYCVLNNRLIKLDKRIEVVVVLENGGQLKVMFC